MTHPALIERITRSLAYMLRHQPERFGLELDKHGYGAVPDVVRALNERLGEHVDETDLETAIHAGDRQRYEILDGRVRALYGHSIEIEPGEPAQPPEFLYVGIDARDADRATRFGLRGGRRRFLHLALTVEDAREAGKRAGVDYAVLRVFALDAWEEGNNFYDRKQLYLCENVPTQFLEVLETNHDGFPPREEEGHGGGRHGGRSGERGHGDRGHGGHARGGHGGGHQRGGRHHGDGQRRGGYDDRRREGGGGRERQPEYERAAAFAPESAQVGEFARRDEGARREDTARRDDGPRRDEGYVSRRDTDFGRRESGFESQRGDEGARGGEGQRFDAPVDAPRHDDRRRVEHGGRGPRGHGERRPERQGERGAPPPRQGEYQDRPAAAREHDFADRPRDDQRGGGAPFERPREDGPRDGGSGYGQRPHGDRQGGRGPRGGERHGRREGFGRDDGPRRDDRPRRDDARHDRGPRDAGPRDDARGGDPRRESPRRAEHDAPRSAPRFEDGPQSAAGDFGSGVFEAQRSEAPPPRRAPPPPPPAPRPAPAPEPSRSDDFGAGI